MCLRIFKKNPYIYNTTGKKIPEPNKKKGVRYAYTQNGFEIAIIDVMHELFEPKYEDDEEIEEVLEKQLNKFKRFVGLVTSSPKWMKRLLMNRSIMAQKLFSQLVYGYSDDYVDGFATIIAKLGKFNGTGRELDQRLTNTWNGTTVKMRLRDFVYFQIDKIVEELENNPKKTLRFVNIGSGSISDTINVLFLIIKGRKKRRLLENRKIIISGFDIDLFIPKFASNSIERLKKNDSEFFGLDVSFEFIKYNWNKPQTLKDSLNGYPKDEIKIAQSEGGIFEYGKDETILKNLDVLFECQDLKYFFFDIIKDDVPKIIISASQKAGVNNLRFMGRKYLKSKLLNKGQWEIADSFVGKSPMYEIFCIKRGSKLKKKTENKVTTTYLESYYK